MNKTETLLITALLLFSLAFTSLLGGCTPTAATKLKVVTSTSLLAYITQQVGGDRVEVTNLIPPAQHPGNFNVRPGDIETLAKANIFLLMGSPGEAWADKLIASADNSNLTIITANVMSANLIPSLQLIVTDKVADALSQIDGKNASAYRKSAELYKQRISTKEADIKNKLQKAKISKVNVIASQRQADFLQ